MILFFIALLLLLISIFGVIFVMTVDLFRKDKVIDYELAKQQGLTICVCPNCEKENIKEDQYCIYCGEPLGEVQ